MFSPLYRNMSTQTTRISDSMEFNNMIPILVALILVVFTYVLLKQLFGKVKGNTLIMVGIEGSGQYTFFCNTSDYVLLNFKFSNLFIILPLFIILTLHLAFYKMCQSNWKHENLSKLQERLHCMPNLLLERKFRPRLLLPRTLLK